MTITVSNLGKRFNREWIFRGLAVEFNPGNIYAITGPNGSGKSTLMQVLWGQVPPSEGKAEYLANGVKIPVEDAFRHISVAAPYMDLLEDFTLLEQVAFHFKFKRSENELGNIEVIEKMQLTHAINKPLKQFSSGMKQRVKLGLALFSTSTAIFLDEPTTNLDQAATSWYMHHLKAVAAQKTIFIATNQVTDYPEGSTIVSLSDLKRVTHGAGSGIQTR